MSYLLKATAVKYELKFKPRTTLHPALSDFEKGTVRPVELRLLSKQMLVIIDWIKCFTLKSPQTILQDAGETNNKNRIDKHWIFKSSLNSLL